MIETPKSKKKRVRSPSYPSVNLEQCLEKVEVIYKAEDRHHVPLEALAQHLGYKPNNSVFQGYISALKQFGLLDEEGARDSRRFKLTNLALDLVTYTADHPKWIRAVQDVALKPKIHKELWEKYEQKLPKEDISIRIYLIREREDGLFNKDYVDSFINQFRQTLRFAKLTLPDKNGEESDGAVPLNVGDFVQWINQGVEQFSAPKEIAGLSEDSEWAFLVGEDSGVPVKELTVVNPPKTDGNPTIVGDHPTPPPNPFSLLPARDPVSTIGDHVRNPGPPERLKSTGPFIIFPLSGGKTFELRLSAPISKKDFERLKTLIELSEDSLIEEA